MEEGARPDRIMTIRLTLTLFLALGVGLTAHAQVIPMTFKYVPTPNDNFVRIFVPGEFNDWGPNNGGVIAPTSPSRMDRFPSDRMRMRSRLRETNAWSSVRSEDEYKSRARNSSSKCANLKSSPSRSFESSSTKGFRHLDLFPSILAMMQWVHEKRTDTSKRLRSMVSGIMTPLSATPSW